MRLRPGNTTLNGLVLEDRGCRPYCNENPASMKSAFMSCPLLHCFPRQSSLFDLCLLLIRTIHMTRCFFSVFGHAIDRLWCQFEWQIWSPPKIENGNVLQVLWLLYVLLLWQWNMLQVLWLLCVLLLWQWNMLQVLWLLYMLLLWQWNVTGIVTFVHAAFMTVEYVTGIVTFVCVPFVLLS